jgi:hypothetical protein
MTLERVCGEIGYPRTIRVDQGSEFVSRDLDLWAYTHNVTLDFSRPGKPTDNAFVEAFNSKVRSECLNAHWFMSLDDARSKLEDWRRYYNEERPHSGIGHDTDFAAQSRWRIQPAKRIRGRKLWSQVIQRLGAEQEYTRKLTAAVQRWGQVQCSDLSFLDSNRFRTMGFQPARISGQVPPGYKGPLYYRMCNFGKPASKVLADYLMFPGRDVRAVNRIVGLVVPGAISDRSEYSNYIDEKGKVALEWNVPIRAVTKANFRNDWPEFSLNNIMLVSQRVKETLEKFDPGVHAFVPVDVRSPHGSHLFCAYVQVGGNLIDAVDWKASGIIPKKVYPNGRAQWRASEALPHDEFCLFSKDKVQSLAHFWDEKIGKVWSQAIVDTLGDILPKEYVFVPVGVSGEG